MRNSQSVVPTRASKIAFFLVFALTGFFFYRTMRPFLLWVGIGGFCAILTWRPYVAITRKVGGRRRIGAAISTALVVFVVVAPLLLTALMVAREGIDAAQRWSIATPDANPKPEEGFDAAVAEPAAPRAPPSAPPPAALSRLPPILRGPLEKLRASIPLEAGQLRTAAEATARSAVTVLTGVLAGVGETMVGAIVWILSLYYFYLDGPAWLDQARRILPLPERHTTAFFREFRSVSYAVFYGYVVCSFAQGLLDGILFGLVGFRGAFLLGTLVAIMALLPLLGSIFVWLPASLWLVAHGRPGAGVAVALWGAAVLIGVDYFMRPALTRGQLEMHPLLVFLAIFGGLTAFGFAGAFLGPLFVALFLAALRIYEAEFPDGRPDDADSDPLITPTTGEASVPPTH